MQRHERLQIRKAIEDSLGVGFIQAVDMHPNRYKRPKPGIGLPALLDTIAVLTYPEDNELTLREIIERSKRRPQVIYKTMGALGRIGLVEEYGSTTVDNCSRLITTYSPAPELHDLLDDIPDLEQAITDRTVILFQSQN